MNYEELEKDCTQGDDESSCVLKGMHYFPLPPSRLLNLLSKSESRETTWESLR